MDKTQDDLDLYFLTRNVQWRYRLDQYEDATIAEMLKTVRSAVSEIKREIFDGDAPENADELIAEHGLKQETDTGAVEALIDEVLAANAGMVAEFKSGKEKAFNALVGQCMKAAKGKAPPAMVNEILKKKLS